MKPERLTQLMDWLKIDATSGHEQAYLEVLERDLAAEGLRLRRLPVAGQDPARRWNLLAPRDPDPEVLLCTHVDTVPPFLPVRREGDTFWGRGACDTKGVQLAMVEALARLQASDPALAQRAGLLLVVGEETDHCGAASVLGAGLSPRRFILGEPTQCKIAVGQKGILKARLRATGRAGHSAFPESGESAIHKLLEALGRVLGAGWPSDEALGETLVNVGTVQGGVAANVFAPEAEAVLMIRVVSSPAHVEEILRARAGEDIEVEVLSQGEAQRMAPPEGVETCVLAFNSDAAWLKPLAPVWLGGPGDIRLAHSVDERISAQELEDGAQLYEQLLRQALRGDAR